MIKIALAKLLTLKVAAVATTAVAAGGVAVAAATGAMPNPFGAKPSASTSAKPGDNHHKGSPSPSLVGLCNAYSNGNKQDKGKALENPAFTALIDAAGGKDKVEAFCADIAKSGPGNRPSDAGRPSAKPSNPRPAKPTETPSHSPR